MSLKKMLELLPAPLRKTNKNCAINVFMFATRRQKGERAATGAPPKVVERERLHKSTKHPKI